MKETPQIRKSIYKPYRFDNTNSDHLVNFEILAMIFPLTIISAIISSGVVMDVGAWPLYIWGISLVVIVILFKLYNNYYHRYYRLIKRTTESNETKTYTYHIQTYISIKKLTKILNKTDLKWRDVESFTSEEEAEFYFDKNTIENKVDEVLMYQAKKSISRPKLHRRFIEENNLSREEINSLPQVVISLVLYTVFITFFSKALWLLTVVGVSVALAIVLYVLYGLGNQRYYRVIERREEQGRYKKTSCLMQTFFSKKGLEELLTKKDMKWQDIQSDTSKESLKESYDLNTTEISVTVTDEIL